MNNKEITNNIVFNTLNMGYSSKDLINLRQLAWDCLPLGCFAGGIQTKFFENINNAIEILESVNKHE